ncbi:MAG: serine/threonine protein phosphatase [Rhodospirillales bacterium]|nr:serine/threonine protein phosphatase [Alphaproteobacteria bacterium]MBL6948352.1 serine/threonine protein phosphatase [Rhodospirillales bacterium]
MTKSRQNPNAVSAAGNAKTPRGRRVYAVGDIHGRRDLLERLHRQILEDAADADSFGKVVVYLGDFVDRGPDSAGVLDLLIDHPLDGFERHHLKGNHEDMMLRFLKTGGGLDAWLMNGARGTFESYGIEVSDIFLSLPEPERLCRNLAHTLPARHRAFLQALEISHTEGAYLFAHAGIAPGVPLEEQSPHDLMWIRNEFLFSDANHGARVVHGHSISPEPEVKFNRIGIDTGAWQSGVLTAAVLEGDAVRFLQT